MQVADAFFTRTQQRVLGLLYGNPSRSFYSNEIVRLSGVRTVQHVCRFRLPERLQERQPEHAADAIA